MLWTSFFRNVVICIYFAEQQTGFEHLKQKAAYRLARSLAYPKPITADHTPDFSLFCVPRDRIAPLPRKSMLLLMFQWTFGVDSLEWAWWGISLEDEIKALSFEGFNFDLTTSSPAVKKKQKKRDEDASTLPDLFRLLYHDALRCALRRLLVFPPLSLYLLRCL